jgi:phosphatidylglycerol---prolipoprotein diacylglyceryl transferase
MLKKLGAPAFFASSFVLHPSSLPVMHPLLFRLGSLEIHTYGVFVAAGFLFGILNATYRAKTEGIAPERVNDLGIWLVIAGMAGGKLFHLVFFWNDFLAGWRARGLASLREGFVFFGGFIAASLTTVVYARVKKLPLLKVADALAPSVALGHAFGRLGCFFEGCCFGKECLRPWAVRFPFSPALRHPTQLYEAAGNLVIFAALSAYYRHKKFDGQIWWLYILCYAAMRFVVEFFRGDYEVHYFGSFTIAHGIAVGMMLVSVGALQYLSKRSRPVARGG